jgi:hypothetical protein
MTNGLANRDWLGIKDKQLGIKAVCLSRRFDKMADYVTQRVESSYPLFVRAKIRESRSEVVSNKRVSLLQSGNTEGRLHKSDGNDLSVSKERLRVVGAPPKTNLWVSFEVIINKDVDMSHLIYNGSHWVVLQVQDFVLQLYSIHLWTLDDPPFQPKTGVN